jgi:hypothetical protein
MLFSPTSVPLVSCTTHSPTQKSNSRNRPSCSHADAAGATASDVPGSLCDSATRGSIEKEKITSLFNSYYYLSNLFSNLLAFSIDQTAISPGGSPQASDQNTVMASIPRKSTLPS